MPSLRDLARKCLSLEFLIPYQSIKIDIEKNYLVSEGTTLLVIHLEIG